MVFNNDINLDDLTQQLYFQYWASVSFGEKYNFNFTFTEYVYNLDIGVRVISPHEGHNVIIQDWDKFLFARLKYGY